MKECDLIMKGGITSGVVYPKLITNLANDYHFKNIGGTSAGAIAAGMTAAAEYNRAVNGGNEGFKVLDLIPNEVSKNLLSLFEPDKRHRKTFKFLLGIQEKGTVRKIFSSIWNIFRIRKSLRILPDTYFGLCSGKSSNLKKNIALTDWMDYWLEKSAGRLTSDGQLPSSPLTFGDLDNKGITLKTITTNLSQRTPINLPNIGYSFIKKSDLEKLMPKGIVVYIKNVQKRLGYDLSKVPDGFYILPSGKFMPVLIAVRLSLSFPVLLTAFPIYRYDNSLRLCEDELKKPRVCWLSDGGITSNFPIHLFDSVLPSRPTFGISLGEFNECMHEGDEGNFPSNRVYLPKGPRQGLSVTINEFNGLFGFLMSIFNSAQTWQDTNQAYLSGYRERIVRLSLKEDEGGMNLKMDPEKIMSLTNIGDQAGNELRNNFDFDEHRWRRVLSAYSAIEKALEEINEQYANLAPQPMRKFLKLCIDNSSDDEFLMNSYLPSDMGELETLKARLDSLAKIGKDWSDSPIRNDWGSNGMPKPSSVLRLVPEKFVE